jgi:peptide/nickel transport system substrate-binding protein
MRRRLRKGKRQAEDFGVQAEKSFEQYFFKRFSKLGPVRRFVGGWIALVLLLISGLIAQTLALSGYYQTLRPVPGGIYNEGVLGTFTNASPLYATTDADATVSQLLFAGLFSYDTSGQLVGDLAKSYEVDARGTTYTVHLKPGLTWHDGKPLTSKDVVFTYTLIQNPDAQSPLQTSWQGITIDAPDDMTVTFKLPNSLAAFPYNLTNGIVPRHILAKIPPSDLRSADFNTARPIGAGPFAWQAIEVSGGDRSKTQAQIALAPFENYQAGKPKLQEFIVHIYASQADLVRSFTDGQLTAVEGLTSVPPAVKQMDTLQTHNLLLRAATMTFFKTSSGVLADQKVRQALVQGADVPAIIQSLGYPTRPVREPFLIGQHGYDPSLAQAPYNLKAAQALLDSAGWTMGKNGVRQKDGRPLTFTLTASDTPDYHKVAKALQQQWRQLGVALNLQLQTSADFQTTLTSHSYDAVLYGIAIGVDPDVFVYWDGSQADVRSSNRLNLSEYKNTTADSALEAGRTRLDPTLRVVKYRPFLQAWQQDAPALGLYQPRVLYLTNGSVDGLHDSTINKSTDRFWNVHNWQIRQAKVTND